jgi:hypothetical protein
MITERDSFNTIESKNYYVILPSATNNLKKYLKIFKAKKITKPFSYNSLLNPMKMTIKEIEEKIQNIIHRKT